MATTSVAPLPARDPDAGTRVAALYEAHGRTVLGLCRFLLRDRAEAEDAAQQSFLSAYRSLLGGAVPREPSAWLATIARNECRARIRQRMREPLALGELPDALPDPLQLAVQNADLEALRAGLATLSRTQREAFLLREFSGLSYGELATALGVTEPAVESLLFRARARLRRALGSTQALLAPVALRDQLAQLIPGFDGQSAGAIAKVASLPLAAKLAAAGAGTVLVAAGSTGLVGGSHSQAPASSARHHAVAETVAKAAPATSVLEERGEDRSRSAGPALARRLRGEGSDDRGRGGRARAGDTGHGDSGPGGGSDDGGTTARTGEGDRHGGERSTVSGSGSDHSGSDGTTSAGSGSNGGSGDLASPADTSVSDSGSGSSGTSDSSSSGSEPRLLESDSGSSGSGSLSSGSSGSGSSDSLSSGLDGSGGHSSGDGSTSGGS